MNSKIERFLEVKIGLNKADNTQVNYEVDLRMFDVYMKNKKGTDNWISEVTNDDIEDFIVHMKNVTYSKGGKDKSYTNTTINRRIACISSFYKYAVDKRWVDINPTNGIELLKVYKEKKDYLTLDEILAILELTYVKIGREVNFEYNSARDRFIISMLATTGLRVSELLNIKLSKMEKISEGYMVTINAIDVKNDLNKRVPIANKTLKYFEEYMEQRSKLKCIVDTDNVILSKTGRIMRREAVQEIIDKQLKKSGLEDRKITPHSFRHGCTTYLRKKGVNDSLIYNILGWKEGIVQVYTDDFELDNDKINACNLL